METQTYDYDPTWNDPPSAPRILKRVKLMRARADLNPDVEASIQLVKIDKDRCEM